MGDEHRPSDQLFPLRRQVLGRRWQMISIWQDALQDCPKCLAKQCLDYREHEDDEGHTDIEYRCAVCAQSWFVDGIDS